MVDCLAYLAALQQLLQAPDPTQPSPMQQITFTPITGAFCTLLKKLFVESWKSQITAHQAIASERAMARELKTYLDGTATQQAAMVIDVEPTVDPKILRDLIKTQVQSETKKIQTELNRMNQKLGRQGPTGPRKQPAATTSAKNSDRGARNKTKCTPSPKKPDNLRNLVNNPQTVASRKPNRATRTPTETATTTTLRAAPTTKIRATVATPPLQKTRRRSRPADNRRRETNKPDTPCCRRTARQALWLSLLTSPLHQSQRTHPPRFDAMLVLLPAAVEPCLSRFYHHARPSSQFPLTPRIGTHLLPPTPIYLQ